MSNAYRDMTDEELKDAREELARERAALDHARLNGPADLPVATNGNHPFMESVPPAPADEPKPAVWPHQHLTYGGLTLEVRKPNESALIAVSMAGSAGVDPQMQMGVFTRFLNKHMSTDSFVTVLNAMTDPDSEISIQGIIQALADITE